MPVGLEYFFFDAGAVEVAVGEAVDSENVAVFAVEPGLESVKIFWLKEFFGGAGGEAEADGVGLVGGEASIFAEAVTHGEDVSFEDVKSVAPRFGGVDVGAVGEVVVGGDFHEVNCAWLVILTANLTITRIFGRGFRRLGRGRRGIRWGGLEGGLVRRSLTFRGRERGRLGRSGVLRCRRERVTNHFFR